MDSRTDLMRGTLDLLILRSLLATPLHGLGIARRIGQITQGSFDVKPGSLFPALYRLEERGLVSAEWGESDTRRRAKFYRLTRLGRKQLQVEEANWRRIAVGDGPRAGVDLMTPRGSSLQLAAAAGAQPSARQPPRTPISAPTSTRTSTC